MVDDGLNQQKGAQGQTHWLPPNKSFRCEYLKLWETLLLKYSTLKMTNLEQVTFSGRLALFINPTHELKHNNQCLITLSTSAKIFSMVKGFTINPFTPIFIAFRTFVRVEAPLSITIFTLGFAAKSFSAT